MSDNQNIRNAQTNSNILGSQEEQSKRRQISAEELRHTVEDHRKWLMSEGKEGRRADLSETNLAEADLRKADLRRAIFIQADLREADLREANLQQANFFRANLFEINFKETRLKWANFFEADLQKAKLMGASGISGANLRYANFENATGLVGNEFAHADITGTKLPKNVEGFNTLGIVEETSKNARRIFFTMLLGCIYSWLTIATTTDVRLVTNSASSPLPIIGTEIPIVWFYWAAPLVLIGIYAYFHFYLDNLWGTLTDLPAIFPDGKRLDERAYPWLVICIVRRHFLRLQDRPLIAHMKEWIIIFLAWWTVPVTLIGFWLRFLPRRDWVGTWLHIGFILFSFVAATILHSTTARTLRGAQHRPFDWKSFWLDRRSYQSLAIAFSGLLILVLSFGAIEGIKVKKKDLDLTDIKEFVPWIMDNFGYDAFADLRGKDLSSRPSDYWKLDPKERINSVKGANLREINLSYANMKKAFAVSADLRDAKLRGALLRKADLQDADLRKADLRETNLKLSELQKANFKEAKLQGANFRGVNMAGADFQEANLLGAQNLSITQLCEVYTLYEAKLDPKHLKQVKEKCPNLLQEPMDELDKLESKMQ